MSLKATILDGTRLPITVQDRLRSIYHRLARRIRRSPLVPIPPSWHAARARLATLSSPLELYRFAGEEVGIVQIENEIIPFLEYAASANPRVVGEIGTKSGGNSLLFTRALGTARRFVGLDLYLQNEAKLRFLAPDSVRVSLVEGDSQSAPVAEHVRKLLGQEQFDLLFIDGDHSYDGVRRDFLAYFPLVRDGGLIAFHDIVPDHATRFGTPRSPASPDAGDVHVLWAQLRDRFEHREFIDDRDQDGYGIGVLVKSANVDLSSMPAR